MANDSHRSALPPGQRLHWYLFERVLGQGGFAVTYLARDENLDQQVAIKEYLPIELAVRDRDFSVHPFSEEKGDKFKWGLDRFITEARTLAKFKHPNIVRVLNVIEANNTAYMVMEYEHGESLQSILSRRKTLEEAELLNILLPVLGGLQMVHDKGFIHRDIKPANIFIRKDSSPVLIDFGSARQALGVATQTLTSLVSPGYAPFEQYYSKSDQQGPWTDIYGLGATMYRAVAGTAPIDAIERSRGMLGNSRDMLVPAGMVGSGRYSDQFLNAIDHALRFNDKERPRSVHDWVAELRGEPVNDSMAVTDVAMPAVPQPRPPAPVRARAIPKPPPAAFTPEPSRHRWAIVAFATVVAAAGIWLILPLVKAPDPGAAAKSVVAAVASPPANESVNETTAAEKSAPGKPDAAEAVTPPPESRPSAVASAPTQAPAEVPAPAPAKVEPDAEPAHSQVELAALREQLRTESARVAALQRDMQTLRATQVERPAHAEIPPVEPARKSTARTEPVPTPETAADPIPDPLVDGLNAVAAGNFETALRQMLPLARSGNAVAQYNVSLLYRNGQGVLANNATALEWLRKSAWQGHAEAQIALARLYAEGIDGRRDPFLSYVWYLMAERNGDFGGITERTEVEKQLQPEQLPQAAALALHLNRAGAELTPVHSRGRN